MKTSIPRRTFLKLGALAGAGLVVGFVWPGYARSHAPDVGPDPGPGFAPNAFVRIAVDGRVTVVVPKSEMGQGVLTALAMIVAEELDVAWEQVEAVEAPAAAPYRLSMMGQLTAGSDSVSGAYAPLRQAGASARALLVAAAAKRWGIPADGLSTAMGQVSEPGSGRKLGYGELALAAAALAAPGRVALKDPARFTLIGQRIPRVDVAAKTNGSAVFGIDVRRPGMLFACVARCPVFGGTARSYDDTKARAITGVRQVVRVPSGIAVLADNTWAARQGVAALAITWDEGPHASYDTARQRAEFLALANGAGRTVSQRGDADAALRAPGAKVLEAHFELPFMAHVTMEPPTFTAHVTATGCELWGGTQAQTACQQAAAAVTGFPADAIKVHTTFLGGGFGRRAEVDFVTEAVACAKAAGVPVQVVWSREDDLHHDYYRPASTQRVTGAVDAAGWPAAWRHHVVAPSILKRFMPALVYGVMGDPLASSGLGREFPYALPDVTFEVTDVETPVPVGFWRSVGFSTNVFVAEHFFDELCRLGGQDPLAARRRALAGQPRLLAVLELAVEKAGWSRPLPAGQFRGLAACSPFGSHVAQVVELALDGPKVRVLRVVSAVDCGQAINPAIIEAQIESGVVFGLSAALKNEVTLARGRVQQDNFHAYEPLRMNECPAIETYLVTSTAEPGGIGEVGVPCVAPAIANALLAARGVGLRSLPIRLA